MLLRQVKVFQPMVGEKNNPEGTHELSHQSSRTCSGHRHILFLTFTEKIFYFLTGKLQKTFPVPLGLAKDLVINNIGPVSGLPDYRKILVFQS